MIAVTGGTVMTPQGPTVADLFIEDGVIVDTPSSSQTNIETVIDAEGCLVGPGFVDIHVHFRDPGETWKEDLATGSKAAAAGGYTAVVVMPNTRPAVDTVGTVEEMLQKGRQVGLVEVSVAAALTLGRNGRQATNVEALYDAGVRLFSDDGDSVEDPELLRGQMERLSRLDGGVVSQHAEDATQTTNGHMHAGATARRHGIGGLPPSAESDVVRRDLTLAEETGCHYHCQHVSSADTVALIREAKTKGLHVTAEVTPHHLYFTDEDLATLDTHLKMYPPVRSEADRLALVNGLRDGTIDAVATDHAPHSQAEKDVAFEDSPRGVIGLETAAAVSWGVLDDPHRFFDVMSVTPAAIAGLHGQGSWMENAGPANVVVFDPNASWRPEEFASRSSNSPFVGEKLTGRVRTTIYKGQLTYNLGANQ